MLHCLWRYSLGKEQNCWMRLRDLIFLKTAVENARRMNRHVSRSLYNFEMFKLTTELINTLKSWQLTFCLLNKRDAFIQKIFKKVLKVDGNRSCFVA